MYKKDFVIDFWGIVNNRDKFSSGFIFLHKFLGAWDILDRGLKFLTGLRGSELKIGNFIFE